MLRLQAAQKSMLLFQKLHPETNAYHRSTAIELKGNLDLECFKAALFYVLDRHKTLRCVIDEQDQDAYLKEMGKLPITPTWPLKYIDGRNLLPENSPLDKLTESLTRLGEKDFIEAPFDLQNGPLWRATLIRLADNKYQFTMFFHHIIVDETSLAIIYRDLAIAYNSLVEQTPIVIPNIAKFETYDIEVTDHEKNERIKYWKDNLKDLSDLSLQTDYPDTQVFQFHGKRTSFHLDTNLVNKLISLSKTYKVTLNSTLLACLYSLLVRQTNENGICIGITSANRLHANIPADDIKNLVNSFFNSIPLQFNFKTDTKLSDILPLIHNTVRGGLKNQLPLDTIFNEAVSNESKPSFSTASPFKILFVLNGKKQPINFNGLLASQPQELDLGKAKFPYFGINLDEQEDGSYECFVEYNTHLFKPETIEKLIKRFKNVLNYFSQYPETTIGSVPYFLEDEINLLESFNKYELAPVFNHFIPDIVSEIAITHPNRICAVYHDGQGNNQTLSYAELDSLSNQLANQILAQVSSESKIIGLCVTRSLNLIISIIAIWKSGKTLVPFEASINEAVLHKSKQTKPSIIVTDADTTPLFKDLAIPLLNINSIHYPEVSTVNPKVEINATDFAYITYTSGTTSTTPSGADNSHGSLINLFYALKNRNIGDLTKVICTALPTFDAFFYDLLVALATNGEIHLSDEALRFVPHILEGIIESEKISYGVFLPDLLNQLDVNLGMHIVTMGSNPNKKNLDARLKANPNFPIEIGYGLTEAGICSSLQPYDPDFPYTLISKSIPNTYMYVLDPNDFSECPFGVPGQIFIGGISIASGYINDLELSKQKFIELAFDQRSRRFLPPSNNNNFPILRLCATGDYGCYMPYKDSLVIKFIGRKDRQIKLSGVRLELNMIENILRQHPAISDAVVILNDSKRGLNAYIVPKDPKSKVLTENNIVAEIREFLAKTSLPMIAHPRGIALIDQLPITTNGKIDLKVLSKIQSQQRSALPNNLTPIQKQLIQLWSKNLEENNADIHNQIDIDTSYEFLGGTSLKLYSLFTEIQKSEFFNLKSPIIFGKQITIRKLEELLIKMMPNYNPFANSLIPLPTRSTETGRITFFEQVPKTLLTVSSDFIFDDIDTLSMSS